MGPFCYLGGERWNDGEGTEEISGEEFGYTIHNRYYGDPIYGFYISALNDTTIKVKRGSFNFNAEQLRVKIWEHG